MFLSSEIQFNGAKFSNLLDHVQACNDWRLEQRESGAGKSSRVGSSVSCGEAAAVGQRWNKIVAPAKVEVVERASCQRGLVGWSSSGVTFVVAAHNYPRRRRSLERGGPELVGRGVAWFGEWASLFEGFRANRALDPGTWREQWCSNATGNRSTLSPVAFRWG